MIRYILKRGLTIIPVLIGISMLVFAFVRWHGSALSLGWINRSMSSI
jgi:ABC-type dipeptide/oligopeptide/nickel transport system permease component